MRWTEDFTSGKRLAEKARDYLQEYKKGLPEMKLHYLGNNIWIELPTTMTEAQVKKRINKFIDRYEKENSFVKFERPD